MIQTARASGLERPVPRTRLWRGLLLAAVGGACGGDSTGPGTIAVAVTVCTVPDTPGPKTCPATSALPLQSVEVTATATPSGHATVQRIVVSAVGLVLRADTFARPSSTPGGAVAVDTFHVPPAVGTITFSAIAAGGNTSGTSPQVTLAVQDTVPPVVSGVSVVPHDSLEPGDSVYVDISASDNGGLARVVVRGLGALAGVADTVPQYGRAGSGRARFRVPPAAGYGTSVSFEVQAWDYAGLSSPVMPSAALALGDFTAPSINGATANGAFNDPLVPGDTLRGWVDATDNHRLGWVGYRIGQPVIAQDSFPVTGATGQFALSGVVAPTWVGTQPLKVFVRDSSGNEATNDFALQVRVLDAVRAPFRTAAGVAGIQDFAYDAKRDALYVMHTFSIDVLPLATMTYGTPIATPELRGGHLDLTPSADSLVFANQVVADSVFVVLVTVDLTQAVRALQTVHVQRAVPADNNPIETGVTGSNKAFIPIINGTGNGEFDQFDLATATQLRRLDAGDAGNIPTFTRLLPSGDRQHMAVVWDNRGQIYSAVGDSFSQVATLPASALAYGAASADQTGTRYLLSGYLLDQNLALLHTFDYPSSPGFPNTAVISALSPDGAAAYFCQTVDGTTNRALIVKVRASDGVVLERILMPTLLSRMLALPDGLRMVGFAPDNTVYVVDLP